MYIIYWKNLINSNLKKYHNSLFNFFNNKDKFVNLRFTPLK